MSTKTEILKQYAAQAKEADRRNDVTLRNQWSNQWRELASESQAKKAPAYLTWVGRRHGWQS